MSESKQREIHVEVMSNAFKTVGRNNNKPSRFVNDMVPPIDLGEGPWQVAVQSVMYQHNWMTMGEDEDMSFIVMRTDKLGKLSLRISSELIYVGHDTVPKYSDHPNPRRFVLKIDELDVGVRERSAELLSADLVTVHVSAGTYQSAKELGEAIAKQANFLFRMECAPYQDNLIEYRFDELMHRSMFRTSAPTAQMIFYKKYHHVQAILGYDTEKGYPVGEDRAFSLADGTATLPPRYHQVPCLMLYSDIVDGQRVGNMWSPLLARIAVTSKPGDNTMVEPRALHFKPVLKGTQKISQIGVQVHDHAGDEINFGPGVVCVSLVFRHAPEYPI